MRLIYIFFKCQGFLQRLFIHYIYFLGHDFNKPSPEELVAINFTEQLLKRELKANGLRERTGPQHLKSILLPLNSFHQFFLHRPGARRDCWGGGAGGGTITQQDIRLQPVPSTAFWHILTWVGWIAGWGGHRLCLESVFSGEAEQEWGSGMTWCMTKQVHNTLSLFFLKRVSSCLCLVTASIHTLEKIQVPECTLPYATLRNRLWWLG